MKLKNKKRNIKILIFIIAFMLGSFIEAINNFNYNIVTDGFDLKLSLFKLVIYTVSYMIIDTIYGLIVKINRMANL